MKFYDKFNLSVAKAAIAEMNKTQAILTAPAWAPWPSTDLFSEYMRQVTPTHLASPETHNPRPPDPEGLDGAKRRTDDNLRRIFG